MQLVVVIIALLLVWAGAAHAGFIVGGIVAAIGLTGAAAAIATTIGTVALAFGVSYAVSLLKPDQSPELSGQGVGGTELDIRIDAEVPQSLIVGRAVTAGSLAYARTYGKRGVIDNSDLIEIIAIADHPCEALVAVYVEGQEVVLGADAGAPGQEVDGYDSKLFVKFFDGSQTAADSFAVAALGTAADQPWTADAIGRGITYARIHSIYNQEKVPGRLRWKFVVDGVRLYDPRKDSTVAGGAGAHRHDLLSTHEWSDNLALIIYNILRGVYVSNDAGVRQFFYGIEGTTADQLPLDVWFAALNEADVLVDLDAGGTEKQFRAGGEITVDVEPLEAIRGLLRGCGGRLVEIGGTYKLYLGAPGLPVLAFTDGAIVANREAQFRPVLGLERRINYVTGSYTSPEDEWIPAVAPPRGNAAWMTEDGRRLPADLQAPMVQSATQMQRVMLQLLNRSRRERKHVLPLPPTFMVVEPGDVVEWTSERNGYVEKLFEVDAVDYEWNLISTLSLTEVDSTDYDWSTALELPLVDGALVTTLPAAKIIEGFDAVGIIHTGDLGTKRPAIRLSWSDPEDGDLMSVRWQLRIAADPSNQTHGVIDDVTAEQAIIVGGLQSLTDYEVRARFESFNGYATEWSLWILVTTPDARVSATELDAALTALLQHVNEQIPQDLLVIRDELDTLATALGDQVTVLREQMGRVNIGVGSRYQENKAGVELAQTAATTANSALAAMFGTVFATTEAGAAEGLLRFVAASAPEGVLASFAIEVRASTAHEYAFSGLYMDAGVTALGGGSRIRLVSDSISLQNRATGAIIEALMMAVSDEPPEVAIVDGKITVDLTDRQIAHYSLIGADAEVRFPIGARAGMFWTHSIEQDGTGGHTITFDADLILPPHPTISEVPGDVTVLFGQIVPTQIGARAIISNQGGGATNPLSLIFYNMIEGVGLHGNLLTCLDAGEADSWDSGVSAQWRDLTGQGRHLERAAGAAAPTFNGSIGALTANEYFSSDGGDKFQWLVDTAWDAFHKDDAKFTMAAIVRVPFAAANAQCTLFNSMRNTAGGFIRGAIWSLTRDSTGKIYNSLLVGASGGVTVLLKNTTPVAGLTDKFIFAAVSVNEAAGAGGLILRFNDVDDISSATYFTPGSGVVGLSPPEVWAYVNTLAPSGSRIAALAAWDRALSAAELDQLYARIAQTGRWPDIA